MFEEQRPSATTIMSAVNQEQKLGVESSGRSRPPSPPVDYAEIRVKGKSLSVPSTQIAGRKIITTGKWLKVAAVSEEDLLEGDTITNPEEFISRFKRSGLKADVFTFAQRIPESTPKHGLYFEWENCAVIPITTYAQWWKERAEYSIRKGVNRAKKLGVTVSVAEFNDALVEAICRIYNETPVRQGKTFWHYQKDFQTVKEAMATYLDRSVFLGAYYEGELIGFMKLTYVGPVATITQILSAKEHFDKRPNNAMIARAVELCEAEGKSHFIYGSFVYYDADSSLTEFKRRHGFEPLELPRYYIPLTIKGRIALKSGLHHGIAGKLPQPVLKRVLKIRRLWCARKEKARESSVQA